MILDLRPYCSLGLWKEVGSIYAMQTVEWGTGSFSITVLKQMQMLSMPTVLLLETSNRLRTQLSGYSDTSIKLLSLNRSSSVHTVEKAARHALWLPLYSDFTF